jgi:hypothetical protein
MARCCTDDRGRTAGAGRAEQSVQETRRDVPHARQSPAPPDGACCTLHGARWPWHSVRYIQPRTPRVTLCRVRQSCGAIEDEHARIEARSTSLLKGMRSHYSPERPARARYSPPRRDEVRHVATRSNILQRRTACSVGDDFGAAQRCAPARGDGYRDRCEADACAPPRSAAAGPSSALPEHCCGTQR